MVRWIMGCVGCMLVAASASAQCGSTIAVSFQGNTVTATGLSVGSRLAIYGVMHDYLDIYPETLRWSSEETTDAECRVVINLDRRIPRKGVWVVTDITTGDSKVAMPTVANPTETVIAGSPTANRSGTVNYTSFQAEGGELDFLVVRPGLGAYVTIAQDGGQGDIDGSANGRIQAPVTAFTGVGRRSSVLEPFPSSGTLVLINPRTLDFTKVPLM